MIIENSADEFSGYGLYHLNTIEKFCRGNKEKILVMVKTFVSTIPMAIAEMVQAQRENDLIKIKRIVHSLKPTLAFYGITCLEKDVQKIEALEEGQDVPVELGSSINTMKDTINTIVARLSKQFL